MGRRAYKKVTSNGTVILHQRYIYRGYLQIAALDLARISHPALWFVTWDPTQPIATRPLAIQKDATWYTYGWDFAKNNCEVFESSGYMCSIYSYYLFGKSVINGRVNQPIQWSCEFLDEETRLVYYNYRYYNPTSGRWINRDPMVGFKSLYNFVNNCPHFIDVLGLVLHWHHIIPQQVIKQIKGVSQGVIEAIRKCLEKQNFKMHGKQNGVMVEGLVHLKNMHGEDKWNQNIIRDLLEVIKCCNDDDFYNFFNKWKGKALKYADSVATSDYKKEMIDFCIEPPDLVLLKELEEAQRPAEHTPVKDRYEYDTPIEDIVMSEAIGVGVIIAAKVIAKKIPVAGWGYAIYSGYKAYMRTRSLGRALFAIFAW